MNFAKRWVMRSALKFVNNGEAVREVGREFQRKGPEKAKTDLAKECLARVKKKREQDDDRKPVHLGSQQENKIWRYMKKKWTRATRRAAELKALLKGLSIESGRP
ncbi:hypothetical protein HELRODRAFT_158666 [Helobdella robusta]|uniref:Uncharacterized protein n=1 Tax=Helobdella robusta TaxID=6412 RepID=T1EN38_HELRO|nr:hypothetical protein HELRODRAFT_158666 [Helobdella robusta]ESO12201.1 hypothetical protein HELRODRAFT_158666 [Helobdella robusta]